MRKAECLMTSNYAIQAQQHYGLRPQSQPPGLRLVDQTLGKDDTKISKKRLKRGYSMKNHDKLGIFCLFPNGFQNRIINFAQYAILLHKKAKHALTSNTYHDLKIL